MRIPIASDLKTRTGAPDKDARLKNSYVEIKGEQPIVRKRPSGQGGIPIGLGIAQGGIGLVIGGVPTIIAVWDDTLIPYTGGSTNWNSGISYIIGDSVWVAPEPDPFDSDEPPPPYYAMLPSVNKNPRTNPYYWSLTPPGATRYQGTIPIGPSTGAIAGSIESAAFSAYEGVPYKSCATKAPVTYNWVEYVGVVGLNIRLHQFGDNAPYDCSVAPTDLGIGNYGTVTII